MSSNKLPPLRHLPQWTRVRRLESCSPRRLPANQPLPLTVAPPPADRGVWRPAAAAAELSCHSDMDPRVASLQRNIHFLQEQHKETLEKLHAEIDYLRRENKELQYKLIMEPPKSSRKEMTHSRRGIRPPTQGSEARTGLYLEEPLQDTRPSRDQALSFGQTSECLRSARQDQGLIVTSLKPLRIQINPSDPPRAPTLQECEIIIRQLYNVKSLQAKEIARGKALLRDLHLSKEITTESYILAKAYLVEGTRSGPSQSGVVLPAFKQSLSSTIAERQRRTRAVQRERFKKTVQ